jgi:hypothetical protein
MVYCSEGKVTHRTTAASGIFTPSSVHSPPFQSRHLLRHSVTPDSPLLVKCSLGVIRGEPKKPLVPVLLYLIGFPLLPSVPDYRLFASRLPPPISTPIFCLVTSTTALSQVLCVRGSLGALFSLRLILLQNVYCVLHPDRPCCRYRPPLRHRRLRLKPPSESSSSRCSCSPTLVCSVHCLLTFTFTFDFTSFTFYLSGLPTPLSYLYF